jgi:hypothetical protein
MAMSTVRQLLIDESIWLDHYETVFLYIKIGIQDSALIKFEGTIKRLRLNNHHGLKLTPNRIIREVIEQTTL